MPRALGCQGHRQRYGRVLVLDARSEDLLTSSMHGATESQCGVVSWLGAGFAGVVIVDWWPLGG
jgi:hypothetical protein